MLCENYDTLKLVCYFQKCFQNYKTAATTDVTAVVAVYYVKTH